MIFRCKDRLKLQNFMHLKFITPDVSTIDSLKIGFFVRNDDKSIDVSLRCFKSRDQSDFENALSPISQVCHHN